MKKKKWLSLLLAFAMLVAICAPSFSSFAASAAASKVEAEIEKLTDKSQLTDELKAEFKALSDADKESIDLLVLNKLFYYTYWTVTAKPPTPAKKFSVILTQLGEFTPQMKAGQKLGAQMLGDSDLTYVDPASGQEVPFRMASADFTTETGRLKAEACLKAWADASDYARDFASLFITISEKAFQPAEGGPALAAVLGVAEMYFQKLTYDGKTPAQIETAMLRDLAWPTYVKPYLDAVAENVEPYNRLLAGKLTPDAFFKQISWSSADELPDDCDYGRIETKFFVLNALDADGKLTTTSVAPSAAVTTISTAIADVQNLADFTDAVEAAKLPGRPSAEFNETIAALRGQAAALKSPFDLAYVEENMSDVYEKYEQILTFEMTPDLAFVYAVEDAVVADAPSVAYNDTIAALRLQFTGLDSQYDAGYFMTNYPDVWAKYNAILALELNTVTKKEGTRHNAEFVPETVDYQMQKPYGDILTQTLLPSLEAIVNNVLPQMTDGRSLQEVVDGLLFTNANAGALIKLVLQALDPESKPSDAAEILQNYPEAKGIAEQLKQYDSWEAVPADFDWGVEEGNYQSFLAPILSAIPVFSVAPMLFKNKVSYDNTGHLAAIEPAAYELAVVPLMEALGIEGFMDSMQYSAMLDAFMNATLAGAQPSMSRLVSLYLPIVQPLYEQVYAALLADPVGFLTTRLPNLVYHLEDGCVFDSIGKLLDALGGFLGDTSAIKQYLSLDALYELIRPTLEQAGITLDLDEIKKLGHLGTLETIPSVIMQYETTARLNADTDATVRQLAKILEPIALKLLQDNFGLTFGPAGEFTKQDAPVYPHDGKMDREVMLALIGKVDGMIGGFVKIDELIDANLCTPEMAQTIITGLYGALEGVRVDAIGLSLAIAPSKVAALLTEPKYDELAAALNVANWSDVVLTVKNGDTVISTTDMGFEAGDRDGFIACITASLRPLVKLLLDGNLLVNTADSYGLYETLIIPVFEALGLTPAATSAEFTANYEKLALRADKRDAYDYLITTVLAPVLGLVEDFAKAPLATLCNLLPNLAYTIRYNPELAFIGNLLAEEDGGINVAGMINSLLGSVLPGFVLPPIDLDTIASMGTLTEKESMSALYDSYLTVVADPADLFVTVFYYLYDTVNYGKNMDAITNLLGTIEGIESYKPIIDSVLGNLFTMGKEDALCYIGTLLAGDVWTCPDDVVTPSDPTNPTNPGDPSTPSDPATPGNPTDTPDTGDAGLAAVWMAMAAAGAAALTLRRRRARG